MSMWVCASDGLLWSLKLGGEVGATAGDLGVAGERPWLNVGSG